MLTLSRIRRTQTGENALGQPKYAETVKSVVVYSVQESSETEKHTAALANRTITDLEVMSPTNDFQPGDAVIVNGITYEVDSETVNHNLGWHGWSPGYTVKLRRVRDA